MEQTLRRAAFTAGFLVVLAAGVAVAVATSSGATQDATLAPQLLGDHDAAASTLVECTVTNGCVQVAMLAPTTTDPASGPQLTDDEIRAAVLDAVAAVGVVADVRLVKPPDRPGFESAKGSPWGLITVRARAAAPADGVETTWLGMLIAGSMMELVASRGEHLAGYTVEGTVDSARPGELESTRLLPGTGLAEGRFFPANSDPEVLSERVLSGLRAGGLEINSSTVLTLPSVQPALIVDARSDRLSPDDAYEVARQAAGEPGSFEACSFASSTVRARCSPRSAQNIA